MSLSPACVVWCAVARRNFGEVTGSAKIAAFDLVSAVVSSQHVSGGGGGAASTRQLPPAAVWSGVF